MHRSRAGSVLVGLCAAALCLAVVVQPAAASPRRATPHTERSGANTPGQELWVARYNDQGNGDDVSHAVVVSPDASTVFVTGSSAGATSGDFLTVAYDAVNGAMRWARRYDGPGSGEDFASAVGVSPDGSMVFVTGASPGSTSDYDYATIAYRAATGQQLWVRRYNGPGNGDDEADALRVSPDGSTVFVTGASMGSSDHDYATVAYRASSGGTLWVRRYNGPANGFDVAHALDVSPDGSAVFVTGASDASNLASDYATVGYGAKTGAQLWARRYNGPGNDVDSASALRVSPDGSMVFVTGYSDGGTSSSDYATLAYRASTGTALWLKRYNGPANFFDFARALGVSPDGSMVFVTGWSYTTASNSDYTTIAFDAATGQGLWLQRYSGPGAAEDSPSALGVSPDGSTVFVTGASWGSGGTYDFATVGYAASSGTPLGAKRYDGPGRGFDSGEALAVSPDGSRVFISGESYGSGSYDYATIAYSIT